VGKKRWTPRSSAPRESARETDYLGECTTEESVRKPAEKNFGSSGA
jgi:hypothetical protein